MTVGAYFPEMAQNEGAGMLTNKDIADLVAFRRELHRFPEVSGEEQQTAARIVAALQALHPTDVMTSLRWAWRCCGF